MSVVDLSLGNDLQVDDSGSRLDATRAALSTNLDFHGTNGSYGSHAWHSFPAKFPPQLPEFMIRHLSNPGDLVLDTEVLAEKKSRDEAKLKKVIQWAYAKTCREEWILRYFGELKTDPCGRCDACLTAKFAPKRVLNEHEIVIVQKALSGIARMSRRGGKHLWIARFGRDRIIKCLLGSRAKTIVQAGLDQLPTWGILKAHRPGFVSELFDALDQQGLIETTTGDYPMVQLTEFGSRVMFGQETAELAWPEVEPDSPAKAPDEEPVYEEDLYKMLVEKRNEMRRQRGNVPSYTIFPNMVLKKLASLKPANAEEAMAIKGIGPAKAESILPAFLDIIAEQEE